MSTLELLLKFYYQFSPFYFLLLLWTIDKDIGYCLMLLLLTFKFVLSSMRKKQPLKWNWVWQVNKTLTIWLNNSFANMCGKVISLLCFFLDFFHTFICAKTHNMFALMLYPNCRNNLSILSDYGGLENVKCEACHYDDLIFIPILCII
jgi:hypothetical protein